MRGVIVGWVPHPLPPPNKMTPPHNRFEMPFLMVLTKNHISEAFRTDFVDKSMLLRSTTKPPFFSIGGRFDQKSFLMRGVIVPPSKLIVKSFLMREVIVPSSRVSTNGVTADIMF